MVDIDALKKELELAKQKENEFAEQQELLRKKEESNEKILQDLVDKEYEEYQLKREISISRKKIVNRLLELGKQTKKYYDKECIVIIDTTTNKEGTIKKKYQYLCIDITIYNIDQNYDKKAIKKMLYPVLQNIVDLDLTDKNVFNFINGTTRKQIN
jgi:hypothetical protein